MNGRAQILAKRVTYDIYCDTNYKWHCVASGGKEVIDSEELTKLQLNEPSISPLQSILAALRRDYFGSFQLISIMDPNNNQDVVY
jgi:hypothetical protein